MIARRIKRLKRTLYPRLIYSPFLRLILFNFWFRVAFVGFVLLVLFLALFLPRIWTVTPPGFLPVIKISGLDMTQAWSLKRSALRAMAAGDFEKACYAWGGAVANNPANPELIRGELRNVLRLPRAEPRLVGAAVGHTLWLLRLTGTNQTDAELVTEVYDRLQLHDLALRLLEPSRDQLTSRQTAAYLKSLFHTGRMKEFSSRWEMLPREQTTDPELRLYDAAYLAGWGPPARSAEGQQRLESALQDTARRTLAHRLRLAVSAHRQEAEAYRESLERLAQWQEDRVSDHSSYWRLLILAGRKAEARELARSYPRPPASSLEAVRLADVYIALDLREEARQLLQRSVGTFGSSVEIWTAYAGLLQEERKWEDLRALALQMRQHGTIRNALIGYSHYLEGRAALGLGRRTDAEAAFEKAGQHPFENRGLALASANQLLKLGYANAARNLLLPLEQDSKSDLDYWLTAFTAAYELKQPEWMLAAASHAYELQPASLVCVNNYAAALLVNRERAEEAVKLTLQVLGALPDSTGSRINHALALALNHRTEDAAALLAGIRPERLSELEKTSWNLGLFQVHLNEKRYDKALEAGERIDVKHLFPNQARWLAEARQQLRETTAR